MMPPVPKSEPLNRDFLVKFKCTTEAKWNTESIDPTVYGFQFRPGTHWNPGLSAECNRGVPRDARGAVSS
jgi:hypothetical protein